MEIYHQMLKSPFSWPYLGKIPTAIIFHDGLSNLVENKELDEWVHVSDHGYPVSSQSIFNPGIDFFENQEKHIDWMRKQHNATLQENHKKLLSVSDEDHLKKLISGGMDFGHDSGSSDITKFLLDSHRNLPYPTSFTRVPRPGATKRFPETVDLSAIDSVLKKTSFDGEFHSFHGIGFDPKQLMGSHDILHLPAYTSGSVNRNIALKYSNFSPVSGTHHVIHMIHPHGSTGTYIGNTHFMDNEVLLPRNITLKLFPDHPREYHVGNKTVKVWAANRQSHMEL
jgi:hypothetical protein